MKAARKRIAILLNWRKSWMGGIIYAVNLISVLNFLEEDEKPEIILLYRSDLREFVDDIDYPYLKAIPWNFPHFAKGYIMSWLLGVNYFVKDIVQQYRPAGIYPLNDWPISNRYFLKNDVKAVAWFPDLQHKFYPHFFTRLRVFMREIRIRLILRHTHDLVVSSHDVEGHFRRFYAIQPSLKMHVLRFVTILPEMEFPSRKDLLNRYQIPEDYFIVSNQFTNHKNHMVVLEALHRIAQSEQVPHVVFTGKTDFKGNEKYISRIREAIVMYRLSNKVSMLGVIRREDQLALMKYARAVVQPSLFEGWSTVIEDAKSLSVPVIASSLPVNMEQLGDTGIFFNPEDPDELASVLKSFRPDGRHLRYETYPARAREFAERFISIFRE